MENKKTFKELAKEKGKTLFIESFFLNVPSENLKFLENVSKAGSVHLVESKQGEKFKAVGIVQKVPVSKFTENLNNRVYPKRLWEKVQKEGSAEGTLCLADHPSDDTDGSVKDIVGVWRNFRVNESNCTADLYLIGKHGKQFLEVLQAGGKCGLSSVGFGELLEDEKTVNPDTYELVRVSDWVLTPSQGVYAETDHVIKENISLNYTNYKENYKLENKRNYKMDNIQLLTLKNNIKLALRESSKNIESKSVNLVESKNDLLDLLNYIPSELQEERSKIERQIEKVEETLKSTISEKSNQLVLKKEENLNLKQKYKTANIILSKMKERNEKSNGVIKLLSYNENAMKSDIKSLLSERSTMMSDIKILTEDRKVMSSDIKTLVEDKNLMEKDLSILLKERETMLVDIDSLVKDRHAMNKDIKSFSEDRQRMYSDINKLITERKVILSDLNTAIKEKLVMIEDISQLLKDRKAMSKDIAALVEDRKVMEKDIAKLVKENKKLKKSKSIFESEEGDIEPPYVPEIEDVQEEEYGDEDFGNAIDPAMAYASDDEDFGGVPFSNFNAAKDDSEDGFLESLNFTKSNRRKLNEGFIIRPSSSGYRKPTSFKKVSVFNPDVEEYFESKVAKKPALKKIREQVLKQKSLVSAVKIVETFLNDADEKPVRISESYTNNRHYDWVGNREI